MRRLMVVVAVLISLFGGNLLAQCDQPLPAGSPELARCEQERARENARRAQEERRKEQERKEKEQREKEKEKKK